MGGMDEVDALKEIEVNSGTQFDPEVVGTFLLLVVNKI
jgi:HD-GYP domain-containing protein (c-di-GMP phosphodiesterase class II)